MIAKEPLTDGNLDDVILEVALPDGLRGRAHRDGMLVFDFGEVPGPVDFAVYVGRIQIINAHLACLKASVNTELYIAPASSETVVGVFAEKNDEYALSGGIQIASGEVGMMIVSLARARVETPTGRIDWRFMRVGPVITKDEIERSYEILTTVLELKDSRKKDALLYAELLARAQAALSIDDNAGALVYAWTVAEGVLRSLFKRWIGERAQAHASRDDDSQGDERVFLDSRRRSDLLGSRMTTWHLAEMLSLVGWLPYDLYRTIRTCESARNKWLHSQDFNGLQHAPEAILCAQELFRITEGIDLRPHRLQSTNDR